MLKLEIAIALLLKLFLEKSFDFLDLFVVILFNLAHGLFVLALLECFLLLEIVVALFKVVNVVVFLAS